MNFSKWLYIACNTPEAFGSKLRLNMSILEKWWINVHHRTLHFKSVLESFQYNQYTWCNKVWDPFWNQMLMMTIKENDCSDIAHEKYSKITFDQNICLSTNFFFFFFSMKPDMEKSRPSLKKKLKSPSSVFSNFKDKCFRFTGFKAEMEA